jgi:molybdate transport system substrate-binding protein
MKGLRLGLLKSKLQACISTSLLLFLSASLSSSAPPPELLIAAASDLAPVGESLRIEFQRLSGNWVRFVYGSSGLLSRQIEQQAPFDILLSANDQYVKNLAAKGRLVPDTVQVYALGRIGLVGRKTLAQLTAPDVRHIAIANPAHAPYGVAAKEALGRLWPKLGEKIVYGENVRQALQFFESGNADAAIVAWSLLQSRADATLLPDNLHAPIRQAGGVVKESKQPAAARAFLDFLCAGKGRQILEKGGFSLPR